MRTELQTFELSNVDEDLEANNPTIDLNDPFSLQVQKVENFARGLICFFIISAECGLAIYYVKYMGNETYFKLSIFIAACIGIPCIGRFMFAKLNPE